MNRNQQVPSAEQEEKDSVSRPRDDRYADPHSDADPRTSEHGVSSIGAHDVNADSAFFPAETPGVRLEELPDSATASSFNKQKSDDISDAVE